MGDGFIVADSEGELRRNLDHLLATQSSEAEFKSKFDLGKNYAKWVLGNRDSIVVDDRMIVPMAYRPLDIRWTYFDNKVLWRWREHVMRHMVRRPNFNLMLTRQTKEEVGALVVDSIAAHKAFSAYDITYNFPLYVYPEHEADQSDAFAPKHRTPNFDPKLYAAICAAAGIDPADQAGPDDDFRAATGDARPSEVKVFDYIYGVLHSPDYRETYAEFLKIDFPRIPYPASAEVFAHVSEKGEALRRLHLMEAPAIGETPYPFMGDGDDVVAAGYPKHSEGKVHINPDQHFDAVPETAWNFHIGGYQPAQKWLKDRRGRVLSYDDIGHYQRIIKILIETDRIMKEIELPLG
jgi:predicted helicase